MFKSLDYDAILKRVKHTADVKNSDFSDDTDFKAWIQEAFDELYGEITTTRQGYFTPDPVIRDSDNQGKLYIEATWYKIVLLEAMYGSRGVPIRRVSKREGSEVTNTIHYNLSVGLVNVPYGYALFDNHIQLYPASSSSNRKIRITFENEIPDVASGRLQQGWENYLVYMAAYLALLSQDRQRLDLLQRANTWKRNVIRFSRHRDQSTGVLRGAGESQNFGGW